MGSVEIIYNIVISELTPVLCKTCSMGDVPVYYDGHLVAAFHVCPAC